MPEISTELIRTITALVPVLATVLGALVAGLAGSAVRELEARMARRRKSGTSGPVDETTQTHAEDAAAPLPFPQTEVGTQQRAKVTRDQRQLDTQTVINFDFALLERYYEDTLGEYKLNSRASVLVAALGFVVILIGVGLALSNFTAVGTVTGLAGVISEAATVMFFRQNNVYARQVAEYHKKLVGTQ